MRKLYIISLIFSFYSVNAELKEGRNILSNYILSDIPSSSLKYRTVESYSGNYNPSEFLQYSESQSFQKCYELTVAYFEQSGYNSLTGGQGRPRNNENESGSNNFASMMSNEQFKEFFKKCMDGEKKPSSSTYRKREAKSEGSGSSSGFGGYLPSGISNPFDGYDFTSMTQCYKVALEQLQASQYLPAGSGSGGSRGEGGKEEESGSNNFASMMSNEQFQEFFKKCMEGEKKPTSSTYRKREAKSEGSGSSSGFGGYLPSGISNPFDGYDFTSMTQCYKVALEQLQASQYLPAGSGSGGSRGEGGKEEESGSNNFASMMSNEQFQEFFKKCMEGEKKPTSSTYRKREAKSEGSGSSSGFGGYLPSGISNPFDGYDFTSMTQCYKVALEQLQASQYLPAGSGSGGSRGEGGKEEESGSNNFASMMSNEQFQEFFKKCMEGEKKPTSSTYRKREAKSEGSGSSSGFGGYLPSGISNPFDGYDFTSMTQCYKVALEQLQASQYLPAGSGSGGSRGEGGKEEESGSNNFASMMSNEQFQEFFKKCMEGEKKPTSSTYRKREAKSEGSGSSSGFGGYLPSGISNPFDGYDFTSMTQCYKVALEQLKASQYLPAGSGSGGSRGEGGKEEESGSNNFASMMSNEQFQEFFKKCMEGEKKPTSSTYRKREAKSEGSGSSSGFGGYLPSGISNPFDGYDFTSMTQCYKVALEQLQASQYLPAGSGSGGSRGEGGKEEESGSNNFASMMSNEQFQEFFKKCMEGEKKPTSSTYRKREAKSEGSGSSSGFGGYLPSGISNPFDGYDFTSMTQCYKVALEQLQASQYLPAGSGSGGSRGEGGKEEESGSNNFASMMSNEQFQEFFKKCMEGEKKPTSSTYRKREAKSEGSGSSSGFGGYLPSGISNPFDGYDFTSMTQCYKVALEQLQASQYLPAGSGSGGSRGEGGKEEESGSNNFASMMSNEQFQEFFKKCMEGEKKPTSSTYRKREAKSEGSGSSSGFGGYLPSGISNPFDGYDFTSMTQCYKVALEQLQASQYLPAGSGSGGSRGEGGKEEESGSNNFASMMSNEQFQEFFKKCMEGEKKPTSSTYRKREAKSEGSGSSSGFGGYLPSGISNPFDGYDFTSMTQCYKVALEQLQASQYLPAGSGSGGSRGEGGKEEESGSNNFASMMSNEQFQEFFKKCMEGEKKPTSSTYRKREAKSEGSGSSSGFGGYLPSGISNPFDGYDFTSMTQCYKVALEQLQASQYLPAGSGSGGSRGEGGKEEESGSNNFASMMSNEQFQEFFKKCMEGEKKPTSSTYRKREAKSEGSGSSSGFGGYLPSGISNPFDGYDFTSMTQCYKVALEQLQASQYLPAGSGSGGSRGEGGKEEESGSNNFASMMSNEQFQEFFKKCMEGEKKPTSSTYRKREANFKRRVRKSDCNSDQTKRNNVLRHISLFY